MNIDVIKVGQEYKNYTELCKALGVKAKSNRGKTYQINEMKQYFDFVVDGRKHTIIEVYDTPKLKVKTIRKTDEISLWSEKALIHLLATTPMVEHESNIVKMVRLTKLDLYEALGYINPFYRDGNYNREETSEILGVSTFATNHFFDSTYDKARKRVDTLLKRMKNGFKIDYQFRKVVCDFNNNHRIPTNDELQMILDYGEETLREMGCESMNAVIYQNRYYEYRSRYGKKLAELKIKYVYECYEIMVSTSYSKRVEEEYYQDIQNAITMDTIRNKINELAKDSNDKTFENRHKKAIDNKPTWGIHTKVEDREAFDPNFIKNGEALFETCGRINPSFNLSHSINELKNEKSSKKSK